PRPSPLSLHDALPISPGSAGARPFREPFACDGFAVERARLDAAQAGPYFGDGGAAFVRWLQYYPCEPGFAPGARDHVVDERVHLDRKSTRLNSSHVAT